MALANAIASLKIVGPLAAIVPVFGPQLEALINVANKLCTVADGVQSNREGFVNLANEAAVCAAAVADRVQSSHPPLHPDTLAGPSASVYHNTPVDSTSATKTDYSPKHVEALTETLKEIESVLSERKKKDAVRAAKFAGRARRALRDAVRNESDQATLETLRSKLRLSVKAFSITADMQGADMLRKIVGQMEETRSFQDKERQESIRREAKADENRRKDVFEAEKRRREEVLKHLEAKLMPVHDACHSSAQAPSECMRNTRVKLLADIESWIDSDGERVYWLTGLAGTGKSTVARSLSNLLAERKLLAASFFVSRNSADRRDARSIARTLVFQLARHFPAAQELLHTVLVEYPDTLSRPAGGLITELVVDPLAKMVWSASSPVIVIDAFDECDMQDGREGGSLLPRLLAALRSGSLPLRLFVTSRPHPSIEKMFTGTRAPNTDSYLSLKLHNIEQSIVQRDIELYFETSFKRIARTEPELAGDTWPEPSTLEILVDRAGVLFIYAATVVRYVGDPAYVPSERLRNLVTEGSDSNNLEYEMLDSLYLQILGGCVGKETDRDDLLCVRVRMVAGSLVHLQDPLPLGTLSALLNMERAVVRRMLESLSSLLIYQPQEPVRLFHPSFPDFIGNPDRCSDLRFRVIADEQHAFLALRCLSVMNHYLNYDICGIGDPSLFNSEVSSLPERLSRSIPTELAYACKHWTTHLSLSSMINVDSMLSELRRFTENHLLHWVEVLSLLMELPSALCGLPDTIRWCRTISDGVAMIAPLLSDVERTMQEYYTPISASALHVYHSALTFMPHCPLHQLSGGTTYHTPHMYSQRHPQWSALLRVLEGHKQSVRSVAFSRDGTRLASGSDDMTVRVWDVNTGDVVATLNGHDGWVSSVAFSPDGTLVASGSYDRTVRMWDLNTGDVVAILNGHHDGWVLSVAFSPDGTGLASGSSDNTACLWDVNTGNVVVTLRGHTDCVRSVVFSPDGTRLASGSDDSTVRVWGVNTGDIAATLRGHTDSVRSVAFSPDGTRLASGSNDRTVRVWEINTDCVIATLQGHTGRVYSVAFSSNGTHLALGSDDRTVRVWDVNTGNVVAALNGHDKSVNSVAFSPEGTRLASGSYDATVRLWDVNAGDLVTTLSGHDKPVSCMEFSPDGTRLASGSSDGTVCLWDVSTGDAVATLQGHTSWVRSVAFSPDGARLASGSDDCTVRVWNVSTGDLVATLTCDTEYIFHVSWSLNGSQILSRDEHGARWTWNAEDYSPIPLHNFTDESALPSSQFTFSVDPETGWVSCMRMMDSCTKRVCWVPKSRRPGRSVVCIEVGARVAMGAPSGAVTFLDLTDWLSTWMTV